MKKNNFKYIRIADLENDPTVKIVTLNRPEVKNAFHPEMISEINSFFVDSNTEDTTKLIVLKGEGSAFCAGADLNWMKNMTSYSLDENLQDSGKLWDMFEAVYQSRAPVIAVAHGAVFGGALGLLACCDYVFTEEKTKFCFSEVKLGLAPAIISGFISRKIPECFYRPYMLSAEIFSAEDSKKMGLIQRIFSGHLEISEVVKKFSDNGSGAMKATKMLLSALSAKTVSEKKELCTQVISELRMSEDAQTRMKKFL